MEKGEEGERGKWSGTEAVTWREKDERKSEKKMDRQGGISRFLLAVSASNLRGSVRRWRSICTGRYEMFRRETADGNGRWLDRSTRRTSRN